LISILIVLVQKSNKLSNNFQLLNYGRLPNIRYKYFILIRRIKSNSKSRLSFQNVWIEKHVRFCGHVKSSVERVLDAERQEAGVDAVQGDQEKVERVAHLLSIKKMLQLVRA
jgi:hypothetical protein